MENNFNIIEYLKTEGKENGAQIAKKLDVSPAFISNLLKGKPIGLELAKKIAKVYKLSLSFVTTGKDSDAIGPSSGASTNMPSTNKNGHGVPYFDIDFIGGFDLIYNSQQVKPSFYIDFLPFNDADYWVNVTGKSMGPLIAHGDIIALKEVSDWKRFLLEGEIYAILTDNGFRTVKIIGKGPDKDHYMLIPYNKSDDYSPQPIPKEVITHVFRVKGAIKKFF